MQRKECLAVVHRTGDAAGLPVGLRLFDALLAGGYEVPPNVAGADGFAAEQHDSGGLEGGEGGRGLGGEDEKLSRCIGLAGDFDASLDDVFGALGVAGGKRGPGVGLKLDVEVEQGRVRLDR